MARLRPETPAGHGELVLEPAYCEWAPLLAENRRQRETWAFDVAGVPVADIVAQARREAAHGADAFSKRLGVPVQSGRDPLGPLVMTGHQPELYHPGVWIKDFLLQRLADDLGALAIDAVVDSDAFNALVIESPCMRPEVSRCREYLAVGGPDVTYVGTPPLTGDEVEAFVGVSLEMLRTLPAPSIARHFEAFAESLRSSAADADNLAELVTFARRRYEQEAATTYLEWPVSSFAASEAFRRFVASVATDALAFAETLNECLAEYRDNNGLRGTAQPFPNLEIDDDAVEIPFWVLVDGRRHRVWASVVESGVSLRTARSAGTEFARLPADPAAAAQALEESEAVIVPRAVTLTLYMRMFVADLFIHGTGGGRYDAVTDALARAWYGVEPPRYVVASLTLYLPLGVHAVSDEEIEEVRETMHRLTHNPDQLLGGLDFDDAAERGAIEDLAVRKRRLVTAIGAPGADKKTLGLEIRSVNEAMAARLEPLQAQLEERLEGLLSQQAAAEVLTDRTYPFCFWSPLEVADKLG